MVRLSVSLTSVCCKTLEKLIRDALLNHMIVNGFLSDTQHGFVHGRSCTTQLVQVVDKLSELLDQGIAVDTVYLDFQRLLIRFLITDYNRSYMVL